MTRTEDRLRDALTGTARTVRREHLRPLEAPARRGFLSMRWLAPAAVASSIAVVAVVSTMVFGPLADQRHAPAGPGQTQAVVGGPPYFVVLKAGRTLVVRDAATGKAVAHAKPPKSTTTFASVAGTKDPHSFIVAAGTGESCRSRILRLRLDPGGGISAFERIATVSADVHHLVATGDGTKIAFNSGDVCSDRKLGVTVVDLPSGDSRTYSGAGGRVVSGGVASLSWAQGGQTLLFSWYGAGNEAGQVRSIDPAHPRKASDGGPGQIVIEDVGAVGRILLKAAWKTTGTHAQPRDVLVGVADPRWPADSPGAAIISVRGGRPAEVVASFPESRFAVFDTASTGQSLLVRTDKGIGRLDNGKFQLLVPADTGSSGHSGATSSPSVPLTPPPSVGPSTQPQYSPDSSAGAGSNGSGDPKTVEHISDFAW